MTTVEFCAYVIVSYSKFMDRRFHAELPEHASNIT